jgi:hypothetical protein
MSTREKRKPVFDPTALGDDLEDLWPTRQATPVVRPPQPVPVAVASQASPPAPVSPTPAPGLTPAAAVQAPQASPAYGVTPDRPRPATVTAAPAAVAKRIRPPEVLLSSEVYDELYRVQNGEKKVRRGLARTMGAIVLDAIEAHAPRLATTWSSQQFSVGEGQLFERPSSNAVPRRRRHATAPRTIVLSGVTAANGQRLDDLVQAWGAGTRSALVEQALRYQFNLLPGA